MEISPVNKIPLYQKTGKTQVILSLISEIPVAVGLKSFIPIHVDPAAIRTPAEIHAGIEGFPLIV